MGNRRIDLPLKPTPCDSLACDSSNCHLEFEKCQTFTETFREVKTEAMLIGVGDVGEIAFAVDKTIEYLNSELY